MRSNIKLPVSAISPLSLLALSRNVASKMTGNTNFTTPVIELRTITEKATELELAIENATFGSRQAKLLRNDLVLEMKGLLRSQADYVRSVCNGDRTMLESSGFELTKEREKQPIPGAPVIKMAKMTGITGQVELKWETQRSATMYQVWMTVTDPSENASWIPVAATSRVRALIDNLDSYKAYWFSVSALGAAGEGAKSDPTIGRAA